MASYRDQGGNTCGQITELGRDGKKQGSQKNGIVKNGENQENHDHDNETSGDDTK